MNKNISTKRFVLILRDSSRFFLDENEANLVKNAIKQGLDYLEVGDSLISKFDFSRLVSSENYEQAERVKKGEWQCNYKTWHQRGDECACGELKKYENKEFPS